MIHVDPESQQLEVDILWNPSVAVLNAELVAREVIANARDLNSMGIILLIEVWIAEFVLLYLVLSTNHVIINLTPRANSPPLHYIWRKRTETRFILPSQSGLRSSSRKRWENR